MIIGMERDKNRWEGFTLKELLAFSVTPNQWPESHELARDLNREICKRVAEQDEAIEERLA